MRDRSGRRGRRGAVETAGARTGAPLLAGGADELPRLATYIGYRVSWSDGRIGRVTGFAADTDGNATLLATVGIAGRRTVLVSDADIEAAVPAQRLLLCRAPLA